MILAVLSCSHMLRVEEDDQASTSEWCPGCGLWCRVEEYIERAWPDD